MACRPNPRWYLDGPGTTPVDVWQRNLHTSWASRAAREIMGPAPDEIQRNMLGQIERIGPVMPDLLRPMPLRPPGY